MKSEVNAKQSKFKKNIPLYVLLLPSIILLILFAYIPMAGLVIAFKDYSPATGIFEVLGLVSSILTSSSHPSNLQQP